MKKATALAAIILISLSYLLTDPFGMFMPEPTYMLILGGVVVAFLVFASLIFKENPKDERESYLLGKSSRLAFLVGSSIIILGISSQLLTHELDNWLVWSLVAMVATKVIYLNKEGQ